MLSCVGVIFLNRSIGKIGNLVVVAIAIKMADYKPIWSRTDKNLSD